MTEWRDVKGYEGLYSISNSGNVLSHNYKRQTGVISELKPHMNNMGYLVVVLYKNHVGKPFFVHRLVAEAFLDKPFDYYEVNHIDANPTNNHIDNLEWVSHSQNIKHAFNMGRAVPATPKDSGDYHLFIFADRETQFYGTVMMFCREYGYRHKYIYQLVNGKRRSYRDWYCLDALAEKARDAIATFDLFMKNMKVRK